MNYNDFSELREAAWGYLHEVGNAVTYNREGDIDVSVKRLHAAIKAIDLGEMRNVLNGVSVHTTAILDREGFPSVMESVKKLRGFCQRYRKDIKAYDPGVKSVGRFCNDALPAMEEELARLEERAKSEPTEEDIEAADTIRNYLSGEDDDIPFNEFMHYIVFREADNKTLVRRGNYLARQFNGVKRRNRFVNMMISRYVDKQLVKRAKFACAAVKRNRRKNR